jgi:hypothetical protein
VTSLRLRRDRIAARLVKLGSIVPELRKRHGRDDARVQQVERTLGALACVVAAVDQLLPDSEQIVH